MSVDIALRLETERVRKAMQGLGGDAAKSADKIAREFGQGWRRTEREAKRAARAMEREVEERVRGIRQVAANTFGDMINDLGDVGEAAAAFGPHGIAIAAGLTAIAGAAVGVGATAYAMHALTLNAAEARAEFDQYNQVQDLTLDLTTSQIDALENYKVAIEGTELAMKAIGVTLGATLAPVMEQAAVLALASALAVRDWVEAAGEAAAVASKLLDNPGVRGGLDFLTGGYSSVALNLSDAVTAAGAGDQGTIERAKRLIEQLRELRDEQARLANSTSTRTGSSGRSTSGRSTSGRLPGRTGGAPTKVDTGPDLMAEAIADMQYEVDKDTEAMKAEGQRILDAQRAAEEAVIATRRAVVDISSEALSAVDSIWSALEDRGTTGAQKAMNVLQAVLGLGAGIAGFIPGGQVLAAGLGIGAQAVGVVGRHMPNGGQVVYAQYEHRSFGRVADDWSRSRGLARSRSWAGR